MKRRRVIWRPRTLIHQIIRRSSSGPEGRATRRSEDREYFDGPNSVVEETTELVKSPGLRRKPASHSLLIQRHISESDESDQTTQEAQRRHHRSGGRARGRSRPSGRVHDWRRSRYSGTGDGGKSRAIDHAKLVSTASLIVSRSS